MVRCVVSAPVDTYSGYGQRALDFVKALIQIRPDWDIRVLSQPWGSCRFGYLEEHNEWQVLSRLIANLDFTPEVWIQITVPNEFQRVGQYNIGVTAGIETTMAPGNWVEGCNRMDLVLTSSSHGKMSLENPVYRDKKTGQNLQANPKNIEVLFEGVDRNIYYPISNQKFKKLTNVLHTNWNFLYVGHWLPGNLGEDRKNTGYTIRMFLEAFKDVPNAPGLIVKSSRASATFVDQAEIADIVGRIQEQISYKTSLPPVYLLHGDLSSEEMNQLYNDQRVKAMVSFTKGEGYGRPFLEFASIGKPLLVSGWSGHLDFLSRHHTALVGGVLQNVHRSAANDMILKESQWFKPNDSEVILGFRTLFQDYATWKNKADDQRKIIAANFTTVQMGNKLDEILTRRLPEFPEITPFIS